MGRRRSKEEKEQEEKLQKELQEKQDIKYMKEAVKQAKKAYALGEVPIGCVIVYEDKIIGRGYNRRTIDKNTLAHAELQAIRKASRKMNDWRLEDCALCVERISQALLWQLTQPRHPRGTREVPLSAASFPT